MHDWLVKNHDILASFDIHPGLMTHEYLNYIKLKAKTLLMPLGTRREKDEASDALRLYIKLKNIYISYHQEEESIEPARHHDTVYSISGQSPHSPERPY